MTVASMKCGLLPCLFWMISEHNVTPWAREKLHQLLNYRYNAELPTVITVAKENMDQGLVDERIITRMLDERICEMVI